MHTIFNRLMGLDKNVIVIGLWEPSVTSCAAGGNPDTDPILALPNLTQHYHPQASFALQATQHMPIGGDNGASLALPVMLERIFNKQGNNSAIIEIVYPSEATRRDFFMSYISDQITCIEEGRQGGRRLNVYVKYQIKHIECS